MKQKMIVSLEWIFLGLEAIVFALLIPIRIIWGLLCYCWATNSFIELYAETKMRIKRITEGREERT